MPDSDLAELYRMEAKVLSQAVTRNSRRFLERSCFRLTEEEVRNLKPGFDELVEFGNLIVDNCYEAFYGIEPLGNRSLLVG